MAASNGEGHAATQHRREMVRYFDGLLPRPRCLTKGTSPPPPVMRLRIGRRGVANLRNPGAQAGEAPREDRLIRKVAEAIPLILHLLTPGIAATLP